MTLSPITKESFEGDTFRKWYGENYAPLVNIDLNSGTANRDLAKLVTGVETHYDGLGNENLLAQKRKLEGRLERNVVDYVTHGGNLPAMVSHPAVQDESLKNLLFGLQYATDTGDAEADAVAKKIAELRALNDKDPQKAQEAQTKYLEAQMKEVHADFREIVLKFGGAAAIYKNSVEADHRSIVRTFSEGEGENQKLLRDKLVRYWQANIDYLGLKAQDLAIEAEGLKVTDAKAAKKKIEEAYEAIDMQSSIALNVAGLAYQSLEFAKQKAEAEAKKKAEEAVARGEARAPEAGSAPEGER